MLFPDVVSNDQHKAAGAQKDQDDDERTSEEAAMETENQEEDLEATEAQELKPEQLNSRNVSHKGKGWFGLTLWFSKKTALVVKSDLSTCSLSKVVDSSDVEFQSQEENMEENNLEGQNSGEQQAERNRESTYHTDPDLLLMDTVQVFVFSQHWSLIHSVEVFWCIFNWEFSR